MCFVLVTNIDWLWDQSIFTHSKLIFGWDFHDRGWENLIFIKLLYGIGFFWWFALNVGSLWKKEHVLWGFHNVHALFYIVMHSMHARYLIKCLLGIFSLVWTLMSTKLWGFSCFLIKNMFGLLVLYLTHLIPHVHFPCFGYAPFAPTFATLVIHWPIPYFFILACHVYLMLCSVLFYLLFEIHFSFILQPSCIILLVHTFISCPYFSFTICLFLLISPCSY